MQSDRSSIVIDISETKKSHNNDIKITDLLIEHSQSFIKKNSYQEELNQVIARYQSIIDDLGLSQQVLGRIETNIKAVFAGEGDLDFKLEALKSIGEDSLAQLLSEYLQSLGIQARYMNPQDAGIILSDQPGQAQILDECFEKLYKLRDYQEILVIRGFFGYTKSRKLVTFSRGGSDSTRSIVEAGVHAHISDNVPIVA